MAKSPNTDRKEYKRELATRKEINCGFCKYHRSENATHRKPRSDKGKNHRRAGR